jgi:CheY-like chemotaxis protein
VLNGLSEQCIREGMDGYLSKPLRAPELRAAIEGIAARALQPS